MKRFCTILVLFIASLPVDATITLEEFEAEIRSASLGGKQIDVDGWVVHSYDGVIINPPVSNASNVAIVLDTSGSMRGFPNGVPKKLVGSEDAAVLLPAMNTIRHLLTSSDNLVALTIVDADGFLIYKSYDDAETPFGEPDASEAIQAIRDHKRPSDSNPIPGLFMALKHVSKSRYVNDVDFFIFGNEYMGRASGFHVLLKNYKEKYSNINFSINVVELIQPVYPEANRFLSTKEVGNRFRALSHQFEQSNSFKNFEIFMRVLARDSNGKYYRVWDTAYHLSLFFPALEKLSISHPGETWGVDEAEAFFNYSTRDFDEEKQLGSVRIVNHSEFNSITQLVDATVSLHSIVQNQDEILASITYTKGDTNTETYLIRFETNSKSGEPEITFWKRKDRSPSGRYQSSSQSDPIRMALDRLIEIHPSESWIINQNDTFVNKLRIELEREDYYGNAIFDLASKGKPVPYEYDAIVEFQIEKKKGNSVDSKIVWRGPSDQFEEYSIQYAKRNGRWKIKRWKKLKARESEKGQWK